MAEGGPCAIFRPSGESDHHGAAGSGLAPRTWGAAHCARTHDRSTSDDSCRNPRPRWSSLAATAARTQVILLTLLTLVVGATEAFSPAVDQWWQRPAWASMRPPFEFAAAPSSPFGALLHQSPRQGHLPTLSA